MHVLSSLFGDLDAAAYFFVSSGVFTLVVALLFLTFGLLIGRYSWSHYKRRLLESEHVVESLKNEVAQLKRKLSEMAARSQPRAAALAPPEIAPSSPLAALVRAASAAASSRAIPVLEAFPVTPPAGTAASSLAPVRPPPDHDFSAGAEALPFEHDFSEGADEPSPAPVPAFPESHAFTVWMEKSWKPHPARIPAPPRAAAFTIWTAPDAGRRSPAFTRSAYPEPGAVVAAVASAVKAVASPSKVTTIASAHAENILEARAAPMIDTSNGGGSIFARALAAGRIAPGAPEMRVLIPESRNGLAPSPASLYCAELESGVVREDPLLGIVFNKPPLHPDELTRIPGVDGAAQALLQSLGVHTFRQIALWTHGQAGEFSRRLGLGAPGTTAGWVREAHQLHLLAHGESV